MTFDPTRNFTPREVVSELDRYIIGQKAAKRSVAIALRNRWRRQKVEEELRALGQESLGLSKFYATGIIVPDYLEIQVIYQMEVSEDGGSTFELKKDLVWSVEKIWVVPPDQYWGLADQFTGRKYEWVVFIEEIVTEADGSQIGRPVSELSDSLTFLWQ